MSKRLLYPPEKVVPERYETDEFIIRPLTTDDCPLDYDAVMSSRKMLRIWEQDEWPTDDFTIEENLDDLEGHQDDHEKRIAFTFTIMNRDQSECFGCIYINRLVGALHTFKADKNLIDKVGDYEASVSFWVRHSRLSDNLDYRILASLIDWFKKEWAFSRVLFNANSADRRRIELMSDLELAEIYSIPNTKTGVEFKFYSAS